MSYWCQNQEEQINKQIKTHETHTALPDMKHIIVDNVNAPLYSWPSTFRKVVQQQIWGEMAVLNPHSSADSFWI